MDSSQPVRKTAISLSSVCAVPGSLSGFTEGMRTSCCKSVAGFWLMKKSMDAGVPAGKARCRKIMVFRDGLV